MMFINRAEFFQFLKEQSEDGDTDLIDVLGADESTPFLVETVFIDGFNRELYNGPEEDGLDDWEAYSLTDAGGHAYVEVCLSYDDQLIYMELYPDDPEHPGRHSLRIIRDYNLIYERTVDQDERTEWLINGMAEDPNYQIDGEIAFHGDTTNI